MNSCSSATIITLEDVLNGNYSDKEIESLNTSERYATTVGLTQAAESELDTVRSFVSKLGEEFRALFDSYALSEENK